MKRRLSPALLLLIGAIALAPVTDGFAGEGLSLSSQDSGSRLLMKHSVTLGINIALSVRIDGQEVGEFARGHLFDVSIPSGSHVVTVQANGRRFDEWTGRLDLRAGQTYSYLVKYRGDQVVLQPVG